MIQKNPYAAYNNSKIQTATPAELTLLLYEGAIKFTNIAIVAMEKNDVQKAHDNIMKTEKIIEEFQATLDHKYPVAKDFEAVYSYLLKRLFDANIRKDPEILEEVLRHLRTMAGYMERSYGKDRKRKQYQDKGTGSVMPAGDSMPDTYIAIMLQSLKKKEQVLDEIIRLDDRQKDTLTDPECPFDVFDETVEAKSACIDQLNQLDSGFEKLYAQVAEELDQNREDYAKEIRDMQQCIRRVTDKSVKIQAQEARNKELMREKFATIHRQAKAVRKNSRAITGYYNSMKEW